MNENAAIGCILGTAVGDALGLPCEGLSPGRIARLFGKIERHRFLLGKGMVSDDTEHTCMAAQALIESAGEATAFQRNLARRLRWWLLGIPAGIGFGTLRAVLKLWLGFPPTRSGVFSAGNGPAMRSAILGVFCGGDDGRLRELVRASTRITHTDPRAEHGALAVALAAAISAASSPVRGEEFLARLTAMLADEHADEFLDAIRRAVESATAGRATKEFAESLGLRNGVSGYVYHTAPVVVHAWLVHSRDYRGGVSEIIACGGDTDTTAAILGGILGAGGAAVPEEWVRGLWEWPRTAAWMEDLGRRLDGVRRGGRAEAAPGLPAVGLLFRNIVFAAIVIFHGLRRLLPPY